MKKKNTSWPTVMEIASDIKKIDLDTPAPSHQENITQSVADGLKPKPFPMKEGYFTATPAQIASLEVPIITIGDKVEGFQRDTRESKTHARKMAKAMQEGKEFPPIMVSTYKDDKGKTHAIISDGSHRAVASIIARVPVEVVSKKRSFEDAKQMFADQRKSRKISSDQTILTGNSPLELYIQDALTSDTHPWSDMISPNRTDKRKITPITAALCIGSYVHNSMNAGLNSYTVKSEKEFDEAKADELLELIMAFGNKTTNPLAFRSGSLKAITHAAVYIFQRSENVQESDFQRWKDHMPKFAFEDYPHLLLKHGQLMQALIEHWNRRLSANRKIDYKLLSN